MFFGTLTPLYSFDVVFNSHDVHLEKSRFGLILYLSEDDDVNKIVEMHVGSISN